MGSIGCGTAASARDQFASQASSGRPGEHQDRRAVVDLVLELLGYSHPADGGGLAVEDGEIEAALVHLRDHHRAGGHLEVGQLGQVGMHALAQRRADLLAGPRVVAVDEDSQRPR